MGREPDELIMYKAYRLPYLLQDVSAIRWQGLVNKQTNKQTKMPQDTMDYQHII